MANYKDNENKTLQVASNLYVRIHVFEPKESVNQEDWYKDMTTFKCMNFSQIWQYIYVGDIIEDDSGARFKILSRHWKWDKNNNNISYPILEFTVERYMRHGKQNPYML